MKRVILRCDGIDTAAVITLNGHTLGTTANQFRRYRFDVKPHLKAEDNRLVITIMGPVAAATAAADLYPYTVPVGSFLNGLPHANFIRKVRRQRGGIVAVLVQSAPMMRPSTKSATEGHQKRHRVLLCARHSSLLTRGRPLSVLLASSSAPQTLAGTGDPPWALLVFGGVYIWIQ
jgi:hypothetical protein